MREDRGLVAQDQVFQRDVRAPRTRQRHPHQPRQRSRNLHHAERGLDRVLTAREHHAHVDALVAHVRERVHRVDRDRREHRKDVLVEMGIERRQVFGGQLLGLNQCDACCAQPRTHFVRPDSVALRDQLVCALADGRELLHRRHAIRRNFLDLAGELRLQPRDPHHEELVQVAGEDRQELQALEQRHSLVARFRDHARVELEPGKLAIDEQARVVELLGKARERGGSRRLARYVRAERGARRRGQRLVAGWSADFGIHAYFPRRADILARSTSIRPFGGACRSNVTRALTATRESP